jgi:hypothetical protein
MLGGGENLAGRAEFNDAPRLHYPHAGGELRDHWKAVRDQDHGERKLALQPREQFEYLRADGNIECGNGLVRDDEFRAQNESARDSDALALPARKFVGIAPEWSPRPRPTASRISCTRSRRFFQEICGS